MNKEITVWDPSEYLDNDETILEYLRVTLEENDPELLTVALGNIARAKGMTQLARETGLAREGLYRALSKGGNPTISTVQKVVAALGYKLSVEIA